MKSVTYALLAVLAATPLSAQTWTANTFANESLLFAGVSPPAPSMGFGCTAPAPEGAPLIETGSHESHRTEAYQVTVGFHEPLFDWSSTSFRIEGIIVTVDETFYQMPALEMNELQGSVIYLPMTDPFILSLFGAERLVLNTGQGIAYEYPTDGLAESLRTAFDHCNARWMEIGNPMPPSLTAVMAGAPAPLPAPTPTPELSALPQSIRDQAAQSCNHAGLADLPDSALQRADLDGDGTVDFILNHRDLRCAQGVSLHCGAANCSIDVFLSSAGFEVREAFLGLSVGLVDLPDGRTGVQITGTYSLCGETGLCPGPQVWDGERFALASEPAEAPNGDAPAPNFTPAEVPRFISDMVSEGCGAAGYVLTQETALGEADFDGDGQPDYIFNGAGLRCYQGLNPFCGASNYSVDVLLSSRDYQRVDGWLGTSFAIALAPDGRPGLHRYGDRSQPTETWNGTAFAPAN